MDKCVFELELNGQCIALTEKQCVGCNFHKTKEELEEGRKMAIDRINSLSPEEVTRIRRKYYTSKGLR